MGAGRVRKSNARRANSGRSPLECAEIALGAWSGLILSAMHGGALFSLKQIAVPLASSVCLHAAVLSGLLLAGGGAELPGRSGGSQRIVEVSFAGDGIGDILKTEPVSDESQRRTEVSAPSADAIGASIREVRNTGKARLKIPASAPTKPARSESMGSYGSGGGIGGGTGSGNGSEGSGGISAGYVRAAVLSAPKPSFPEDARIAGFEGKAVLTAEIDEAGDVTAATIRTSSGREDCDVSALDTVRSKWKFEPARRDGIPVRSEEKIVVTYALKR